VHSGEFSIAALSGTFCYRFEVPDFVVGPTDDFTRFKICNSFQTSDNICVLSTGTLNYVFEFGET